MSQAAIRAVLVRCPAIVAVCVSLPFVAACSRDDPVSVLEVTTTVTPTVASIARDTQGVRVTIEIRNPLPRAARVVVRPGRTLARDQGFAMFNDSAADSWGLGPALLVSSRDSTSDYDARFIPLALPPPGRTMTFEPGFVMRYDYTLHFKPVGDDSVPELVPGRFVVRGQWNTIESPGVEIEVTP